MPRCIRGARAGNVMAAIGANNTWESFYSHMSLSADVIWNDYEEGTAIEPGGRLLA